MSDTANQSAVLFIQGEEYRLDQAGYLLNHLCWKKAFAEYLAAKQGLELTPDHWQLIEFARHHYARYDDSPPMRALVKWVQKELDEGKGSSRYLYLLFPDGPGKQISLFAGLPKPVSCI